MSDFESLDTYLLEDCTWDFNDVCGLEEAKKTLAEHVIFPLKYGTKKTASIILLYGAPGTGKTYLARALARQVSPTPFYALHTCDIASKYLGDTEKLVKALFEKASSHETGAVILLDDFEIAFPRHTTHPDAVSARVRRALMQEFKSLANNVTVVCCTQEPWRLTAEFLEVIPVRVYIGMPDKNARKDLLKKIMSDSENQIDLSEEDWDILADIAEGLTGSDITVVTRDAVMNPVRELTNAKYFIEREGQIHSCSAGTEGCIEGSFRDFPNEKLFCRPVTTEDLMVALSRS